MSGEAAAGHGEPTEAEAALGEPTGAEAALGEPKEAGARPGEPADAFVALYDRALPYVYGYLLTRCGRPALAEEITADTMLAAVDVVVRDPPRNLSTAWLVGIARHKLVDYWRRLGREESGVRSLARAAQDDVDDPWDVELDGLRARETLDLLTPQHRIVLTLRYLDDLPVGSVAEILDRTIHATEALLVRAKAAFRRAYSEQEESTDA